MGTSRLKRRVIAAVMSGEVVTPCVPETQRTDTHMELDPAALIERLAELDRVLDNQSTAARQYVSQRNRAAGDAVRAEKDMRRRRDVARSGVRPADAAEMAELSAILRDAHRATSPPWESPSWFKLFRRVDVNGSGLISFDEFAKMVRSLLKLPTSLLSESRLEALWLALDADGSGLISSGEFGKLMRIGAPTPDSASASRHFVYGRNRAAGDAVRAEKDMRRRRDVARSGVRPADAAEMAELSAILRDAHRATSPPWESPSWFKLFRRVDVNGSGLISFDEFAKMVRSLLKLPTSLLSESRLEALWLALDADGSGLISSGEFGAFFKLSLLESRSERASIARLLRSRHCGGVVV